MSELVKAIKEEFEADIEDVERMCTPGDDVENEVERYAALIKGVEKMNEKSQAFDEIKAVMDLPETSIGETFTKLRKVKEIVERME